MTKPALPPQVLRAFFREHDHSAQSEKDRLAKMGKKVAAKSAALMPMRQLLRSMGLMGVQFKDGRAFSFYETESSPSWRPGNSLCFDYPAPIEIAIPNDPTREGAVAIRVAIDDPDKVFLERPFKTMDEALEAVAGYLGRHAIELALDPRDMEANRIKKPPEGGWALEEGRSPPPKHDAAEDRDSSGVREDSPHGK